MTSLMGDLEKVSKKDAVYLPALCLPLAKITLAGNSDGLQRMVPHPAVLTTTQQVVVASSSFPASSSSHLLHPQPCLIKGLCVVSPAPIEVRATNYPFILAVIPSAQHSSPYPLYALPSSTLKNITFFPEKNSPPALTFFSIPFSALPWCFACS